MATNVTSNPFPMGKLLPGGTTVSIAVTTNYSDLSNIPAHSISIRADPNNSGTIYVCNSAAAPDITNYTNVLDELSAGAISYATSGAMNTINLANYYIGASDNTSFAIAQVLWS